MIYVFGAYELDTTCYELRHTRKLLSIEPMAFDLLTYLVQQRHRVVSKDELFAHLWPDQFVSESALVYHIMVARKAVADTGRDRHIIKTIHGRGYGFIATVEERLPQSSPEPTLPPAAPRGRSTPYLCLVMKSAPDAERRQVTVLYCHLMLSSAQAAPIDTAGPCPALQEAQEVCAKVIRRFDGHVAQYQGDGLMVYFGYPHAHEDGAQRAVRTGLEMVQEIAAFATSLERQASAQLAVQVGIHTGSMVVNVKGSDLRHASLPLAEAPLVAMQLHSLTGAILWRLARRLVSWWREFCLPTRWASLCSKSPPSH